MSINPLKNWKTEDRPRLTLQQHVEAANAHLAQIGRSHELEWIILNGSTHIQWKR